MASFLEGLKNIITSGPTDAIVGGAETATDVMQYLGLGNGKEAGMDAVETIQRAFAGKLTTQETVGGLFGATADWLVTGKLEEMGVPRPLAIALGEGAQAVTEKLTTGLTEKALEFMKSDEKGKNTSIESAMNIVEIQQKNVAQGGREVAEHGSPQSARTASREAPVHTH